MREQSPNDIARKISLYIFLVIAAIAVPLTLYFSQRIWTVLILSVSLLVGYYIVWRVIRYNIEFFVYRRIKLIYKTISRLKTDKFPQNELDFDKDIIGDVNKEVLSWARESKNEITQLREQAQFRKEFVGNLAHELRTPAFNMQGYLLTLLEGGLEDPSINTKYLKRADKNLERLIDLINDLDDISRMEGGEDELDYETFPILDLVEEIVDYHEDTAKEKGITVKILRPEKEMLARADRGKISQVITNLIVNAIRYSNKKCEIEVRFYDMAETILVEIEDNGIGIAEEDIPRLFERFFRVDSSRARHSGGSGLGLAIVKHIMDVHEQSINVRSAVGEGSVFSFTLAQVKE